MVTISLMETTVLLAPTVIVLLGDLCVLIRQRQVLALGCPRFDLPQFEYNMLRTCLQVLIYSQAPQFCLISSIGSSQIQSVRLV